MAASPVIAQWLAAKEQQPDALLFFRMGDFYELFFDDAVAAARRVGHRPDRARRARGQGRIAMCGVPIHAAEGYLARLIRRGFRVAVAEQMEGRVRPHRQGAAAARGGAAGDAGHADRGGRCWTAPGPTCCWPWRGSGARWAPPGSTSRPGCSRPSRWATWPPCSAGSIRRRSWRRSTCRLGDHEARRAPEMLPPPPLAARARVAEAFGATTLDGFGAFTRCGGDGGGGGAGLRALDPGRHAARAGPRRPGTRRAARWRWTPRPAPAWR